MRTNISEIVKQRLQIIIIFISSIALLIIIFSLFDRIGIRLNSIIFVIIINCSIPLVKNYLKQKYIKEAEKQLPIFLSDISEICKSGISITESIIQCSVRDYGKLSKNIKKLSSQLSWGIPFIESMEIFKSHSKSKNIEECIDIFIEIYNSGGDITLSIESISKYIRKLNEMEEKRKSMMYNHIITLYFICYMFLVISLLLLDFMIPIISESSVTTSMETIELSAMIPCHDTNEFPCIIFNTVGEMLGITENSYYITLMFLMSVILAFFSGLVVGEISENSITSGTKHSLIMCLSVIIVFEILIKLNLI